MTPFSHLHVHTQYSLLDGAASINSLYDKALRDEMPALAITDHGNMFGVFEFVKQAWKKTKIIGKDANGKDIHTPIVKPIIGCEFYMVKDRHAKAFTKDMKDVRNHQLFLAKNEIGYKNLVKLTSLGFIEGMYSKYPRIDKELVLKYHEGLIATTCCLGAIVPQTILNHGIEKAEEELKWWLNLFGEDYYIELQRHNIPDQEKVNVVLLQFAKKYNIPIIASNDSHYTDKDDYNAHDILLCVNTGEKQSTPGFDDFVNDDAQVKNRRFKFPNNQFYMKTTAEMKQLFHDLPQAIDNTNAIVDKIIPLQLNKDILLPAFPIPKEFQTGDDGNTNQWNYLHYLTYEGARERYKEITEEVRERIDFELFTIKSMGFSGYFLIVSDFIKKGREIGVFVGPGRGSAAGSAVAYCIGITNIDPIKYNLLFERFLNPDRKSMPDIDTDFDDDGRQKVIDYVVEKYGQSQVAQIITYGTMAAKSSIKDVARVMDLPLAESNLLAKLVPDRPGTNLNRMLHAPITKAEAEKTGEKSIEEKEGLQKEDIENIKRLRDIYDGDSLQAAVLKEAVRLEGSVRNTGIHAAGIIIAPTDLTELIPVATSKESNLWVTQIGGNDIESAGVIKMDFLGLKTLSILKTALELIKQRHGKIIDLDTIPLDDELTFQLYQKGETNGTFQFESVGMQKHLRDLKPDKFGDLIAMNALFRPGPMQYIPNYIARKHGEEAIQYDLVDMEEYLADTYGITVYQEQVMLLSQKLAGFSKGDADVLRKAMGKKDRKTLDKLQPQFLAGAKAKGHSEEILLKIWTDWEAFAQYAFNKSHSTCYAMVSYQTGFLKAHYPSEYMAAVLNHQGAIEKITFHMEECKRMGLKVLGPDVNESQMGFAVNAKGEIRFGFQGLKGAGEAAIESIITERSKNGPFKDVFDFIKRVNLRVVNKRSLESLVYSGSFDCFNEFTRAQYLYHPEGERQNNLEKIMGYGQALQSLTANTTNTLFGDLPAALDVPTPKIPKCAEWPLIEKLNFEKDVTGMYMSGHPLDNFKFEFAYYNITPIQIFNTVFNDIDETKKQLNKTFKIGGLVSGVKHKLTKSGQNFGELIIEDYSGNVSFTLWRDQYLKFKPFFELGLSILIIGSFKEITYRPGQIEFKISNIVLLETIKMQTTSMELSTSFQSFTKYDADFFITYTKQHPGATNIKIKLIDTLHQERSFNLNFGHNRITVTDDLVHYLQNNPNFEVAVADKIE